MSQGALRRRACPPRSCGLSLPPTVTVRTGPGNCSLATLRLVSLVILHRVCCDSAGLDHLSAVMSFCPSSRRLLPAPGGVAPWPAAPARAAPPAACCVPGTEVATLTPGLENSHVE
jgi:hypothetical protein